MIRKAASVFSGILSPLLIPTYITILLLWSGFHFSMYSWPVKRFLLVVVIITTAIMPSLTWIVSILGKNFFTAPGKPADNRIAMLFVALYYYLGYFLLSRMPQYAIFKILLLAGAILIVVLTIYNIWRDISRHMAAAGGAFGMLLALALRIGINPLLMLSGIILVSGALGMSLMIQEKHSLSGIAGGYLAGFIVFFLIFFLL